MSWFKNPFFSPAPDPFLFFHDGWYYLTFSAQTETVLCRSRTIAGFSAAETKTIWKPDMNRENSKDIWAPEIHFIENKWWIYYAATRGRPEERRSFVLEHSGGNLWEGTWREKGKIFATPDRWAIDGTVLQINGSCYFVWSGWEGEDCRAQNLYTAKMASPWALEGTRVLISKPEYEWECHPRYGENVPAVNEGPAVLYTDRYVNIVYSASHYTSPCYCLGLLRLENGKDPLVPGNWHKSNKPLFLGDREKGIYSPGHNSFFISPDGKERWFTYHAFLKPPPFGDMPRCAFAVPFTLDGDEMPVLGKPVAPGTELPEPSL
jgi:GH43 family beta-xylosidase